MSKGVPSVLFINRVYPPSSGATGEMLAAMAEALALRGWEVTVLATAEGGTEPFSKAGGVRVARAGRPLSRRTFFSRAMSYVTMIPALFIRALMLPRMDFVVTLTDPPMLASIGPLLAFFKRSRSIHWAQDIYPELAEELGVLSHGGMPARLLRAVSTWSLRCHDRVVSIGRCMSSRLAARGIDGERVTTIPNWTVPQSIHPMDHVSNLFRAAQGWGSRFVVVYSGNMGLAHEFDIVLDAAQELRDENILFVFIGDGPRRVEVERKAAGRGQTNVRFLPPQPRGKLNESLSAADVHLVTMRPELCGLVVPSKFYGVMAAGRPCIYVGPAESEVARLITEHAVGRVVASPFSSDLAKAIVTYRDDLAMWSAECARARLLGEASDVNAAATAFSRMLQGL